MTKFSRRSGGAGGTVFLAAVAEDRSVAYTLMVNNMGEEACVAAYVVHYADRKKHDWEEDCDFLSSPCSTRLTEMKPYPNYTEGDLWDVLMVESGVNV